MNENTNKVGSRHLFKKGDQVKIIDDDHRYRYEHGKVYMYYPEDNKYYVDLNIGESICLEPHQLARVMSQREQLQVWIGQLRAQADLALDIGDKDWFEEVSYRITPLVNELLHRNYNSSVGAYE